METCTKNATKWLWVSWNDELNITIYIYTLLLFVCTKQTHIRNYRKFALCLIITDGSNDEHKDTDNNKASSFTSSSSPSTSSLISSSSSDLNGNASKQNSNNLNNANGHSLSPENNNKKDSNSNNNNNKQLNAQNGDHHHNNNNHHKTERLQLNEKKSLDGFKRLYTENEDDLKQQLNKIITNDAPYQKLSSQSQNGYDAQMISDDDELFDKLSDNASSSNTPMSVEQENMRKYFDLLSADQQTLLKSKLPLLSDITTLDKRNEILMNKLTLCGTTFDFLTTVQCFLSLPHSLSLLRICV